MGLQIMKDDLVTEQNTHGPVLQNMLKEAPEVEENWCSFRKLYTYKEEHQKGNMWREI